MSPYDNATTKPAAAGPGEAGATGADSRAAVRVDVRPLARSEEYHACVALQRETWGAGYREAVPATVLRITQKMGGIAAGAFLDSGELVGFVYGLTGLFRGRLAHWSHMLAVKREYRDRGIGYRLKQYQREQLARSGVEVMYWTFDPLVARNAHLNVNRLGVKLLEYVPDMYTDTGSDLHAWGTDRFLAESRVTGGCCSRKCGGEVDAVPVIDAKSVHLAFLNDSALRVDVPLDAESMGEHSLEELTAWRQRTREVFMAAMARGYEVTGFYRDGDRCYYVLTIPGS